MVFIVFISQHVVYECIKLAPSSSIVSYVCGLPQYLLHMIQAHSFDT